MSLEEPLNKKRKKNVERLQCQFFIKLKNRNCSMSRKAENKFCAEHSTTTIEDRVPCPKDPSHSVWKKNLSKHLKKCNASKDTVIREKCFEENLNAEELDELVLKVVLQDHRDEFMAFIDRINTKYGEIIKEELQLKDSFETEDSLNSRFEELTNQKHIIQQSSIISHLKTHGILSGDRELILEFGCGKLELSRYVNKFLNSKERFPNYLLIDRASPRLKYDTKFVKDYTASGGQEEEFKTQVQRYKIDIKDLALDKAIDTSYDKMFAISKHLCGVATDLTLRCCLNSVKFSSTDRVIAIAMCCRHCCVYDQLLPESKQYLSRFDITRYEFENYLIKLTSWATCGKRENQLEQHFTNLTYEERLAVGLKARRIIDESRRFAMESHGYKTELCRYVKDDISLENSLMICYI